MIYMLGKNVPYFSLMYKTPYYNSFQPIKYTTRL